MRREYYFYLPRVQRPPLPRILFLAFLSPNKEPSRAKPSVASPPPLCRKSIPSRIDRFEMRELCAAVIPWCDDLSIASNRADLYALVTLSRTAAYLAIFEDVPRLTATCNLSSRIANLRFKYAILIAWKSTCVYVYLLPILSSLNYLSLAIIISIITYHITFLRFSLVTTVMY